MQSMKRRLTAAVAAAAALAVLAGCSSSSGASGSVSYWAAFSSTDTQKYFQQNFVDSFNKESKDAQVTMDVKQLQNLGSLTDTAVSAGRGADVVYAAGPSSALGFASAKRIDDLDSYAEKYDWKSKLQPWAYQASEVNGKLTSVPVGYGSVVMFYNPAVFKKHGWTVPTTAAEFDKVAKAASDAGLIPVGAGNSGYKAQSEWYLTAVLNAAVGPKKLYDTLTGAAKFTDKAYVDAITTFKEQIDKGWWGGGKDRWFTNTDTDMFTGLADGKVAMYMTGTWSFGSASTFFGQKAGNDADWDWAPLPSLSDSVKPGVYPLAIGTSLSVNAASKNKDGSAAFIDSLVNDPAKSYAYLAKTGENPPPLTDVSSIPSSVDKRVSRLYTDIPTSTNLGYASWTFFPAATDSYLYTEFDKVITGSESPADYLAGLQKTFDGEKAAGKVITPFAPSGAQK
ncbi:ABC transporter substrate-binding protein [Leifsonia poae]|uniref:ABC transporter substrate-binding protein n=1 Tax=Leifsonia poae TaxID=110933 RepID=UPI001CBA907A|nr:extracellular solute-binding protein [Leifsonia poae]